MSHVFHFTLFLTKIKHIKGVDVNMKIVVHGIFVRMRLKWGMLVLCDFINRQAVVKSALL
jgi:hypothetical protein